MHLFGTDGIRGHFGTVLTPALAYQVGHAVGEVWSHDRGNQVILLGEDSRLSSPILRSALKAGLQARGWQVWELGLCPTPAVAYLTATQPDIRGGIMISASHNPPADNGIKFFDRDGSKLSSADQQLIEALIPTIAPPAHPPHPDPSPAPAHLLQKYESALLNSLQTDLSGLHIVLDMAWGSAVRLSAQVFRQLGARVHCLHDRPDGTAINVNCGSTHLQPLQSAVQAVGADMGFAFDGDADRVLAVTKDGQVINGDYILYFWGKELLEKQMLPHQMIVTTVMANLGLEKAWQNLGGRLERTPVGDQYVHSRMLEQGAMLGGEQSGHILCRHYGISGDGLMTALHVADLIKHIPIDQLLAHSFTPFPQFLHNVKVVDRELRRNWQKCTPMVNAIQTAERAMADRGRVLVRASGTEPVIRVMVEAETTALARQWLDYLVSEISLHLGV
jgi:phosphoglucosamine mutase